eukprot:CAMPEP_0197610830 /NCGR_PEP_ID=MMETSP1326-20131121/54173_1 /TAXON_ID=1155430 /ORGANISM="Genus nov. species nov., Strain RCC2288" /LENGTH=185 /DNA_ID=CAMNT_0043179403 /DNA_START=109 /DNA_END=666 /DNA_ORIENTATION=-
MKVKLDNGQSVEALTSGLGESLDGLHVRAPALKERLTACLVNNTTVSGANSSSRFASAMPESQDSGYSGLQNHINGLKATIERQRMDVPVLVMKQTTTHLETLAPAAGALLQLTSSQEDASWQSFGKEQKVTDAQLELTQRCASLPELQLRLQVAISKMGKFLSQVDGQRQNTTATSHASAAGKQ